MGTTEMKIIKLPKMVEDFYFYPSKRWRIDYKLNGKMNFIFINMKVYNFITPKCLLRVGQFILVKNYK